MNFSDLLKQNSFERTKENLCNENDNVLITLPKKESIQLEKSSFDSQSSFDESKLSSETGFKSQK